MSVVPATAPTAGLRAPLPAHVDVVVVGSGFSGLAMAARLRRAGLHDFLILERGADVGGTWRDNSYPGCACDVPSHLYSLSFAPNPDWSHTFSAQAEIQAYLRRVADEEGLRPHVRFHTELEEAAWDATAGLWSLETRAGQGEAVGTASSAGSLTARVLVAAAGPLSEPSIPDLPGLDRFTGRTFHSAAWDHEHDLTGERVAVVGTGASAIQFVPRIQPKVGRLHVFQRTAPWVMPRPSRRISRLERFVYRHIPGAQRLMRAGIYWAREGYAIPLLDVRLSRLTEWIARRHLRRQVPDPGLRTKLTPDYRAGCKRILVSNDYLPSLTRPNVEVVTDGVREVRERSVVAADGTERGVDTIIFGTGFHVTDVPIARRVRDGAGRSLAQHWEGGMQAHRGTTVAGFPNLFLLLGPNTGLGHTSVVYMAEAQADYVMRALEHMRAHGTHALAPTRQAQEAWSAGVQGRMKGTVWTAGGCASWYLDAGGRNTTLWPDHTFRFARALRRFDPDAYAAPQTVPATAQAAVA